jgi:hypothetical protein
MSATYSAEVFFGAFVKRGSTLGKKLDKYIDKAGGTPAETEIPGVEVISVGSQWSGEIWLVAQAKGSSLSFERHDEVTAPQMLTEDPAWRPALAAFFERIKAKEPPAVGWHFAGSVM